MEQIRKHNWEYNGNVDYKPAHRCRHCKCKREINRTQYVYQEAGAVDWGPIKPECITRTPNAEQHSNTAPTGPDKQIST